LNQPYLIAIDLDGTTLKNDKTVSAKTKQTLRRAAEEGHKVCIATGRPHHLSKAYYEELELDTPLVNFNGAYVHHPHDPNFGPYHTTLPLPTVKEVIATCERFNVRHIMVELLDNVYIREKDIIMDHSFFIANRPLHQGDLSQLLTEDCTSILIQPQESNMNDLFRQLQNAHAEVIEQRSWGAPWHVIEIIRHGVNKWVGVERIAAYYGIPRDRIIAFGDGDNDLEMIQHAGQGVAMGNAIDALKEVAYAVTSSNEEDGIAQYLEKVLW
jgi:5-amino-6-(5-phospho-D-ribitylamino)uracil phosphatase